MRLPVEDDLRRELSQLVADHLLGDSHVVVHLAIVHLKLQADEVGQNGRRARLCPDRWDLLPRYGTCDGKPGGGGELASHDGRVRRGLVGVRDDVWPWFTVSGGAIKNMQGVSRSLWAYLSTRIVLTDTLWAACWLYTSFALRRVSKSRLLSSFKAREVFGGDADLRRTGYFKG